MKLPKIDTGFAKQQYASMPPWAKGAIAIGVLAGAAYLIHKIASKPKEWKSEQGYRDEEKAAYQELDKMIASGKGPSMSKTQMEQFANQLHAAMDGYGTDEEAIKKILTSSAIKNDADILGIIRAYGIREVNSGFMNPSPNFKGTLGGALTDELSRWWLDVVNRYYQVKGIKHRW